MNAPAEGLTASQARAQLDHAHASRRNAEAACALDFLVYGEGDSTPTESPWGSVVPVTHADRCVYGEAHACSRTYDPMPYDEAEPVDLRMYEGTSIGALYGLNGDTPERLELEGWTLAPRSVYE
jgi:hypothetical protein